MSYTVIAKDLGEIYTRIYDSKPFVHAEISTFVREFELKRNDREVENLFGSLENTSEICDSGLSRCALLSRTHLPELRSVVADTLAVCQQALQAADIATGAPDKFNQQRTENCARRELDWQRFVADVTHKRSRIDNTFEEKEEELREFYTDLASKLRVYN